jgi:internalin A
VAGLTNLVWLDIGGNRGPLDSSITNVPVLAGLKQLQWLSLYYLRVNDLSPLTGLVALTNLDVSWNSSPANVSALNGLTNLLLLHATADGLSNIVFVSFLPQLHDLDFGYNNVHDLSPAVGRNLTSLQAYYNNPLTNASLVAGFHQLQHLSLGGDGLTNVSYLSGLTNLQELWIDGNPGVANITPILGLTNIWHLDVDGDAFTNLAAVAAMTNLTDLEMNSVALPQDISFLGQMVNLNSLDLGNDHVGSLVLLTNLTLLNNLYLNTDFLTDISLIQSFPNLNYTDVRGNLLDTNAASAAWNVITNLQNNYVNVDYSPQNISPTLTVWESPADQCIASNDTAYFAASASSTSGGLTYQWQFNGVDLPGQTNDFLLVTGASPNQSGSYRAVVLDYNGAAASFPAQLYVGDPNCGLTIMIVQQPVNAVAAPGEDVNFGVVATTTLVNLYYQWLFNGTNISGGNVSGDTTANLALSAVDASATGIYQVLVWDDSSNVVASTAVQLKVVDVVSFTDPGLSNLVVQALVAESGFTPGNPVHLTDLDNLSYLYVSYQGITNISGLDCARYLNDIDLSGNPIIDPSPLGWLTALQYLNLDSCGVNDASFVSGLTNLYQLNLNNNSIHEIPDLQALAANLSWLEINHNGPLIYSFRLASVTNLYDLGLHDDGLPDIAFTADMSLLASLDVGADWIDDPNRNYVSDISPLTGKTAMNWLSLSFDQVTNVPIVVAFTNVTSLYLSSNHFGNLNFITNMPNLNTLAINYSTVTNLAPLTNHTLLGYLDVGYIATTNLSYVSGLINLNTLWAGGNHAGGMGVVSNLISLQVLGFDQNGVHDLSPLTGLTSLYYLNLENNQATNVSVISNRTTLTSLYLAGNQIHDLTPLSGLTNVQWMSLGGNGFTDAAPLTNLHALVWLTMQSNNVQNVAPLAGLTNLYYSLDLSANQITDMSPLTNLHKLTWLGMWQNKMTTLPSLVGLSNVTSLDFWGNQLTNAAGVSGMTQLNWLGLSRNNFTTIQTLTGLPNLNSLELYSNHLSDVTGLAGLTSLNWLYLHDNNLSNIHPLTSLTSLYYTDVRGNWLDTNSTSAAMADIAVLQSHNTYVDYIPQNSLLLAAPASAGVHQFQFSVYSPAGDVVQIWRSSDLSSWTSLGLFTNTTGTNVFTDSNASGTRRFYRAQQ